jgi:hypothetical protein
MRFTYLPLLALLFTSCANEGTVVRKDSNPMPFYHSLGIEGSYKLALRDGAGAVHSQLVTPEVYQDYAEGDYFNDAQPPPASSTHSSDVKDTIAFRPAAAPTQTLASKRIGNGGRVVGNGRGTGVRRSSSTIATRQSSAKRNLVASAHKSAPSAPSVPKPAIPVVAAHFSVAVQPPAPVQTTAVKTDVPAITRPVVANRTVAVAQKSSVQTNVQKASTNRVASAPVSRRSYHVAEGTRMVPPVAKVASGSAKATPSSHVAFVTQKVAAQPATSVSSATQASASKSPAKAKTTSHSISRSSKSKPKTKHVAQ